MYGYPPYDHLRYRGLNNTRAAETLHEHESQLLPLHPLTVKVAKCFFYNHHVLSGGRGEHCPDK